MNEQPELLAITDDNLDDVLKLSESLTASQKRCVADNLKSVAKGSVNPFAWYRAVYVGKQAAGFVMLELYTDELPEEDQPALYLWRFMMAREWQSRGIGRKVLDLIVEHFRPQGVCTIYTSCVLNEEDSPYRFYLKYGFSDTGKDIDDERVLRFALPEACPDSLEQRSERPWQFLYPKVALITIWTDHLDTMRQFYHKTLGFYIKQDLGDYVEFESHGVRLALCHRKVMAGISPLFGQKPAGQRFELALPCDDAEDLAAAWQRLVAAGVTVIAGPATMPWGQRAAFFADPDGNIHELFTEL